MNEYPYFNPYAPYMPMQNSAYTPANQIARVFSHTDITFTFTQGL
jgi:hypothetical protein